MITVVGMWEPGYSIEQMYIEDTVWKQSLSAFGVDRFVMSCSDGTIVPDITNPEQYVDMQAALDSCVGDKVFLVFSNPEGATELKEFAHPPGDVVYIFGNPIENLTQYVEPGDARVHITTPNHVDMLACSCVAAVLYARCLDLDP